MVILVGCGVLCVCFFVRFIFWLFFMVLFCFYSFFVLLDFIIIIIFVVVFCFIFGVSDFVLELGLFYVKYGVIWLIIL